MNKFIPSFLILLTIITFGCTNKTMVERPSKSGENFFADRKGCFLLYNMKTDAVEQVIGDEVCKEQFPACSTFKVPLAVIAFDAGILKDENQVLKWNGKKDLREVANRDHNAKTWMSESIVWFSQRLTSQLKRPALQKYLKEFEYGNKDLRGGLTQAWLVSPASAKPALKISAYQQIDFMKKLWRDQLPASKRAQQLIREITFLETSPKGFRLSGKTGSNFYDTEKKMHFGWFIAHLQKGDHEYLVVTNMSDLKPSEEPGYGGPKAKDITKNYLSSLNLW